MQCSHPGCQQAAVIQWSRLASADENGGIEQVSAKRVALDDELNRARQRAHLRELTAFADDPEFDPKRLPALKAQIAREQAVLDAMTDTVVPAQSGRNVVAVFACDTHRVDDDTASQVHEAHCLTAGPCGCATEALPKTELANV